MPFMILGVRLGRARDIKTKRLECGPDGPRERYQRAFEAL
jgi:hypothetical protein